MSEINFIILAAGKGTRMKNGIPKVLHKVCDKTLISYVLDLTAKFKDSKVIAITSPDIPDVDDYIKNSYKNIDIIHQKERLGTGHAVKLATNKMSKKGFSVILYGDTPFISRAVVEKMLSKISGNENAAICVLGFKAHNPTGYGRLIINQQNKLRQIIEEKEASQEQKKLQLCNSGVMILKNEVLPEVISEIKNNNSKQEYYLTDAVEISAKKGFDVEYEITDEVEVIGINSQSERASAEHIRQQFLRNKHLESGVVLISPETNFFSEETEIFAGTVIHPYVIFKGRVKIAEGVEVFAFSHLENCEVKKSVSIGPYARIRPDTVLNENSRIGNFVEVKNSEIGKDSKINHLSYIGDTKMGEGVNIGAGTITCNYDGKEKHQTIIENGVFVGSNSSLVAPVTLGRNSVIGAGTTLFNDAESDKITINKMPLVTIKKQEE